LEAVNHGNLEMVNMILNSASVELQEILFHQKLYDGSSALMLAIESFHVELIDFLMRNNVNQGPKKDGTTIPMKLVSKHLFELTKDFLSNGNHNLFLKDEKGRDLLFITLDSLIFFNDEAILFLEFLIENGFSPNHEMETIHRNGGKKKEILFQKVRLHTNLALKMIQLGAEYVNFDFRYKEKIKQIEAEIQDPSEVIPYQNDPVKYLFLSVIHNRLDFERNFESIGLHRFERFQWK
jgi:hypothetical protein